MPNLLTSFFSGLGGGLIVVYLQGLQRRREEQARRQTELQGLLRVLSAEITGNRARLNSLITSPIEEVGKWILGLSYLQLIDWNQSKIRLAQLASKDCFAALNDYYDAIREAILLGALLDSVQHVPDKVVEDANTLARRCIELGDICTKNDRF